MMYILKNLGSVAQLVEHQTENLGVSGAEPLGATNFKHV